VKSLQAIAFSGLLVGNMPLVGFEVGRDVSCCCGAAVGLWIGAADGAITGDTVSEIGEIFAVTGEIEGEDIGDLAGR